MADSKLKSPPRRTADKAHALLDARLKLRLEQAEAGALCKLPASTISKWERGYGGGTVKSRRLMEQYAQALQKHAQAQGYDPAEFAPHLVFPGLFAHPLPENGDQRSASRDACATSEEDAA